MTMMMRDVHDRFFNGDDLRVNTEIYDGKQK